MEILDKHYICNAMLTPEIFRYLSIKKDPVIVLLSKYTKAKETYNQIGKSFFQEFKNATYRSVYGYNQDSEFYTSADENIKREAILQSRFMSKDQDTSKCQPIFYAEDFGVNVIEELFSRVNLETLPNYPGYFERHFKDFYDERNDIYRPDSLTGMYIADLISIFGSPLLNISPADLVVLFLSEGSPRDFNWYPVALKMDVRVIVQYAK
jgi:hypothetical protein